MLKELTISNVAVIKNADICFSDGLNIFTGETGSGKSILIGAVSMVLGVRTSKELIRTGEEKATVTAIFSDINKKTIEKINGLGIDVVDNEICLFREITQDTSNSKIDGKPVTTAILKQIGSLLINIHGQMDTQMLFNTDYHRSFVDSFGKLDKDLDKYKAKYDEYITIKAKLDKFKKNERDREQRIDLLSYQVNEISNAKLSLDEEKDLIASRDLMRNSEKLSDLLSEAHDLLNDNIIDPLEIVSKNIDKVSNILNNTAKLSETINDAKYNLEDSIFEISDLLDKMEYDPKELDKVEDRLDLINRLKKKYGDTIEEILKYFDDISNELDELNNFTENAAKLENEYKKSFEEISLIATKLTKDRKTAAKDFCAAVTKELSELDMPKVRFDVLFGTSELTEYGADTLEFIISVNPGEDLKPLAKIASGGEMSRIMLAIKNVVSGTEDIGTLIFDEIDSGISGRAAQKVGMKLRSASIGRQILCVTHLAQVAAFANSHYLIEKEALTDKTFTNVTKLDYNGKVLELARITSGENITDAALQNAKELLKEIV